jgi:hypothetical protein
MSTVFLRKCICKQIEIFRLSYVILKYLFKPYSKCSVPCQMGKSRNSAVGIATGYELDDDKGAGVRVPVGARIFTSSCRPERLWGSPSLLSNRHRGVKRPGREADHSPPTSAEVRKMWVYIHSPIRLHDIVLN